MTAECRARLPELPAALAAAGGGPYRAFGVSESFAGVAMVEFRFKNGNRVGLPYPWLGEVAFDPSAGIVLGFTTGPSVTLRGRNLLPLFSALLRHQAVWVCEADSAVIELTPADVPVVASIALVRRDPLK